MNYIIPTSVITDLSRALAAMRVASSPSCRALHESFIVAVGTPLMNRILGQAFIDTMFEIKPYSRSANVDAVGGTELPEALEFYLTLPPDFDSSGAGLLRRRLEDAIATRLLVLWCSAALPGSSAETEFTAYHARTISDIIDYLTPAPKIHIIE